MSKTELEKRLETAESIIKKCREVLDSDSDVYKNVCEGNPHQVIGYVKAVLSSYHK